MVRSFLSICSHRVLSNLRCRHEIQPGLSVLEGNRRFVCVARNSSGLSIQLLRCMDELILYYDRLLFVKFIWLPLFFRTRLWWTWTICCAWALLTTWCCLPLSGGTRTWFLVPSFQVRLGCEKQSSGISLLIAPSKFSHFIISDFPRIVSDMSNVLIFNNWLTTCCISHNAFLIQFNSFQFN